MAKQKKFPALAVILLIFALAWIYSEVAKINLNLPWIPIILAIIAIGMIWNRLVD